MLSYKYKVGDLVYMCRQHSVSGPHKITKVYNGDNCCDIYTDKLAFYSLDCFDSLETCVSEDSLFKSSLEAQKDLDHWNNLRKRWIK